MDRESPILLDFQGGFLERTGKLSLADRGGRVWRMN